MKLVTVSGAKKNIGKTTLAAHLIAQLTPCYGVKCSIHDRHPKMVIDNIDELSQPGTDTCRFITAGAKGVWWVRSDSDSHCQELSGLLGRFGDKDIVVAEGNSILRCLVPDAAIFIAGNGLDNLKPSAYRALGLAHAVLFYAGVDLVSQTRAVREFNETTAILRLGQDINDYNNVSEFVKKII